MISDMDTALNDFHFFIINIIKFVYNRCSKFKNEVLNKKLIVC